MYSWKQIEKRNWKIEKTRKENRSRTEITGIKTWRSYKKIKEQRNAPLAFKLKLWNEDEDPKGNNKERENNKG